MTEKKENPDLNPKKDGENIVDKEKGGPEIRVSGISGTKSLRVGRVKKKARLEKSVEEKPAEQVSTQPKSAEKPSAPKKEDKSTVEVKTQKDQKAKAVEPSKKEPTKENVAPTSNEAKKESKAPTSSAAQPKSEPKTVSRTERSSFVRGQDAGQQGRPPARPRQDTPSRGGPDRDVRGPRSPYPVKPNIPDEVIPV